MLALTKDIVGSLLEDDTLMIPVIENDPLLRRSTLSGTKQVLTWEAELDFEELASVQPIADKTLLAQQQSQRVINDLKNQVSTLRAAYDDLQKLTRARFERDLVDVPEPSTSQAKPGNEDESYFASYAENELSHKSCSSHDQPDG